VVWPPLGEFLPHAAPLVMPALNEPGRCYMYALYALGELNMAKSTGKGGGKETIVPPSQRVVREAARNLRSGDPDAGRILSERSVAQREGVKRPPKKP
jgi:hypothetical protein